MNYKEKDWLKGKYCNERLALAEMAHLAQTSVQVIRYWMIKHKIPRRSTGEAQQGRRGKKNNHWRGGRYHHRGYVFVYRPDHPYANGNYVREHRLVIEEALDRYLKPNEHVHHKNGIRDDNRLENLELVDQHRRQICPRCGWPLETMCGLRR